MTATDVGSVATPSDERAGGVSPWAVRATIIVIVAATWEALPRTGVVSSLLLPPLTDVLAALVRLVVGGDIWPDVVTTGTEVLLAFVIVVPASLAIGFALGLSDYWRAVFEPLVSFLVGVPKSIFLPLFILALGLGMAQKVAFGVFQAVFVIIVTMTAGMRSVPPSAVVFGRSQAASPLQMFWHVYRPAVTPIALEGIRLGMVFTVTGVVLAEMYASRAGLGQLVSNAGRSYDLANLLAVVILVAALSMAFNAALRSYERRATAWRQEA